MAITGHKTLKEVQRHTEEPRKAKMASAAIARMERELDLSQPKKMVSALTP